MADDTLGVHHTFIRTSDRAASGDERRDGRPVAPPGLCMGGPTRAEYLARMSPSEWEIMLGEGPRLARHRHQQDEAERRMAEEAVPPPPPAVWMCSGCGGDVLRGLRCPKCGGWGQERPAVVVERVA